MNNSVDVIFIGYINSKNRMTLLEQTIDSFNRTMSKYVNRVIFIDDNSPLCIPKQLTNKMGWYTRNDIQIGVGASKNKGALLLSKDNFTNSDIKLGKYLYFSDSDVYFTENWLEKLIETYEINQDRFKLIGGGIHPFLQPRKGELGVNLTSHDAVSGWSWFLERETWNKYGKLDGHALGSGQSEDWAYCQRIREDGYLVGCLKEQVIAHTGMTNSEGNSIVGRDLCEQISKKVYSEVILL